ncbi:MAG: iron-sulfur cluster assembly scaffold protein [Candidatus Dojkabacteria bacterium]|nr:MAG: iron-sulfur cluster assembly scaffold protein [Candidatus Dojkabacteria bacterium]
MSGNPVFNNERIVDHYMNPRHFGKLSKYTHKGHFSNPSCGDEITVYLHISQEKVKEIGFEGSGCSLCIASMSLLSEKILGKEISELDIPEEDVLNLTGVAADSKRKMCVLIGLYALGKATGE